MFAKITVGAVVIFTSFLLYVASRDGKFHYERSGVINAPADKIFPYISNLQLGAQWSPYEKKDPNMKKTFSGTDGQAGSTEEFDGNSDVGSGKIEILKVVPNEAVDLKLTMLKPVVGENLIQYRLTPEGGGTKFTWSMSGDGGFIGKLIAVFIDCEKMIAGDLEIGIQNLKTLVESRQN